MFLMMTKLLNAFHITLKLIEIVAKGFGELSQLNKIQSPVLQEYVNASKMFLGIVAKNKLLLQN